jgi:hypothetical protein
MPIVLLRITKIPDQRNALIRSRVTIAEFVTFGKISCRFRGWRMSLPANRIPLRRNMR